VRDARVHHPRGSRDPVDADVVERQELVNHRGLARVHRVERLAHSLDDPQGLVARQAPFGFEQLAQRAAVDPRRDDEGHPHLDTRGQKRGHVGDSRFGQPL
jgi:hypothetical protein